ncbi:MAG: NAD-dependent epimerase/dehydratase family protein [Syntrophales bacterium]|jgi:UDP-2-acetamido-2,6-beta-L-arabino-hexul-4-ose reductase|nr:NAD-dependent epimerase/dehydratase family protein [Syntrophales bacterium]MDX9922925.1 NAD-dependent epimerase/dehydratase family protein [Syntrophales bacterium]
MKTVLVTGSGGFIGRNLLEALGRRSDCRILEFEVEDAPSLLRKHLAESDIVYHIAGVNRPTDEKEFIRGNVGLTEFILDALEELRRTPVIIMSSSTQAVLGNPYGASKKKAEEALFNFAGRTGAPVYVYRLTNVFGKWCRPNYNSVVATFCHNIARDMPVTISDRTRELELVYIDDVVTGFLNILDFSPVTPVGTYLTITPTYRVTLGELADMIGMFRDIRHTLTVPDMSDAFTRRLYATYLSYLEKDDFAYGVAARTDERGTLAELLKSEQFGQIFVSRTRGGFIRGNHYHTTKVEKFCVIQGEAVIRFRHILSDEVLSYNVSGDHIRIVDIPPGYTHSIENLSGGEMIVLFWANEIFDPENPDTHHCEVQG